MSFRATEWSYSLRGLSGPEKAVLNNLAWHHNGKTGQCNPSSRLIADETGYSQGAVNKMLIKLKERGLIDEAQDPVLGRVFILAIVDQPRLSRSKKSAPTEQPYIEQETNRKAGGFKKDWKERQPAPMSDGRARAEKRAADFKAVIEPTVRDRGTPEEREAFLSRVLGRPIQRPIAPLQQSDHKTAGQWSAEPPQPLQAPSPQPSTHRRPYPCSYPSSASGQ